MKKIYLLPLLLLFIEPAFCQTRLGSEKTPSHINVNGTKVWLLPPTKFTLTNMYKGFNNTSDPFSSIMLTDLPAGYENFAGAFAKTGPTANNVNIVNIEKCSLPATTGCMFITATQTAQGYSFGKYMLLFGDKNSSIMITASYSRDSVKTGEKLKSSLLSVYYDAQQTVDVRASIGYTFNENGVPFHFKDVMGTSITFTGFKTNSNTDEEVSFIAARSFSNFNIPDKKAFCEQRVKQHPYQNIEIDAKHGTTEIKIDGLDGYELFATALSPKENSRELIQQIILFDEDGYYIMVAMYKRPATDEKIAITKQFAKTFKRKPINK